MKYVIMVWFAAAIFGLGWGFSFGAKMCEAHYQVGDYAVMK